MKSHEYWQKRSEATAELIHRKADLYNVELANEYIDAALSIKKDIESFYARFAKDNEVTMAQAKRLLDKGEMKEFKMSLNEFIRKAQDNEDGRWTKELNNVYYRTRISRYEALLIDIRAKVEDLLERQYNGLGEVLTDTYKEGYYRTLYEINKGAGIGITFAKVNDQALDKVLRSEWAGGNYSSRLYADKDKLLLELQTALKQAFIRGDAMPKTIAAIEQRMGVAKSVAARLVRTESAYILGEATMDGYKQSGVVKQYQFLATLDRRTSTVCRSMDNLIFALSEKEVGVNYPPLHSNCRSTTVPYFYDDVDSERIARDNEGKVYYVPANMSYQDWYDTHVEAAA